MGYVGGVLGKYRQLRKYKTKRKTRLSHWSCRISYWSNEVLHSHYIQPNPNARCKTHAYRYSTFKWSDGYKFFAWVIKPRKLVFNTSTIFDKTRFILNHNYNFKIGHLKQ